jgi:hypothetical protein
MIKSETEAAHHWNERKSHINITDGCTDDYIYNHNKLKKDKR